MLSNYASSDYFWRVITVTPRRNYSLLLHFADKSNRIYNAMPLLDTALYAPLVRPDVFMTARAERGTVVWNNDLYIAQEHLYASSVPQSEHGNDDLIMLQTIFTMFMPEEQWEMLHDPDAPTYETAKSLRLLTSDSRLQRSCNALIEEHIHEEQYKKREKEYQGREKVLQLKEMALQKLKQVELLYNNADALRNQVPPQIEEAERLHAEGKLLYDEALQLIKEAEEILRTLEKNLNE